MHIDRQSKSLHYYNCFAVKGRIDTTNISQTHSSTPHLYYSHFFPTDDDYDTLKGHFNILISRIICNNLKFFKEYFSKCVTWHISHKYYKEMSVKSHVVS
jgi:hypothetical protein